MPQQRGNVDPEHARRIVNAIVKLKAAQVERDRAIAAALKAGGSCREVGAISGLSPTAVMNIGHAHGWPTEEQRSEKDRRHQELAAWRQFIEDGIARILAEDDSFES